MEGWERRGGFYCGTVWRGVTGGVQDAVIRKCIFSNEVMDGRRDGVKRAVMAAEGRKEPTGGRVREREGGVGCSFG